MAVILAQLRRRFTLEQQAETAGDGTLSSPVVGEFWGSLEGVSGSVSGLEADAEYRLRLRYRDDIDVRSMRIGLKGTSRKFKIISPPLDPDGRQDEMTMLVREVI